MAEGLGDWPRTHACGALRTTDLDREAALPGWVDPKQLRELHLRVQLQRVVCLL
jgi:hypothetical protein